MKKLILLFISLLAVGAIFQACDNSKTYAEMLEEERDGVNDYIKKYNIDVISIDDFEKDTITQCADNGYPGKNEYVGFSNGVYMQIVKRFGVPRGGTAPYPSLEDALPFTTNNLILTRFVEVDILLGDTTYASTVCNKVEAYNTYPDGFRYTIAGTSIYGQFIAEPGLAAYYGYGLGSWYDTTSVPAGWLMALQYVRDGAHVRLIVPSKSGHSVAQSSVYPYFYDIRALTIYD